MTNERHPFPRRWSRRTVLRVGVPAAAAFLWACGGGGEKPAAQQASPGTGQQAGAAPSGKPIKLGYLSSMSGTASIITNAELEAIKIAVDEINSKGGVLGRPLQLVTRDDKGRADDGRREARELVENEDVFLIMGVINSAVALAVSEYAKEAEVPFIDTIAQTAALTEEKGHEWVVRTANTHTGIAGRALAKVFSEKLPASLKRWYVIGPDYEYGHRVVDDFWAMFTKLRPDVQRVGEQWPAFGAGEYSAQINAILAAKPDAVYTSLWGNDLVAFIKQAKGFRYFDQLQHTGWAQADPDVTVALGDDYPKGIWTGTNWGFWLVQNAETEALLKTYRERTNGAFPYAGTGLGYSAVYIIKAALDKAGAVDRKKFMSALRDLKVKAIYGDITIRGCDGQAYGPVFVGMADKVPGQNFYGVVNPVVVTPENFPDLALPCQTIEELRKKK
jgi:branched-chain amino acid transport system substrate-binding protein